MIGRKMWKRFCAGILILVIVMFSSHDIGSITGGPIESKHAVFDGSQNLRGFNNLIFSYDDYLRNAVDDQQSPGAAVAIVYRGDIVLLKGYGVRKADEIDPVDLHTAFRIGSVSKGFASILTGILVQQGYLSWDDPVKKYLTSFTMKDSLSASQLTIRNILNHTSGFPAHTYTDLLDNGASYESIKSSLCEVPLAARPGQIYGYQNVVYSLIGDIVQKITGQDYNYLLRRKIFEPLQMAEASTDFITFNSMTNSAFPHIPAGKAWKSKSKNDRYYSVSPASGVNASASDMAQWLLALTGYYPEVISRQTIHDISAASIQTPRKYSYRTNWKSLKKTYYGLGWRVFQVQDHDVVYHGGYVEGFRSEIAFDPSEGIGIAVMFNSSTPMASQCIPYFFDQFYNIAAPNTPATIFAQN